MKRTFFDLFQLLGQKILLVFARISLLTALSSLLFIAFSSTPGFDTLVNHDTTWTYVYDGGKWTNNTVKNDLLRDVITLKDGNSVFVGQSAGSLFIIETNTTGKIIWQKLYDNIAEQAIGCSIILAKNGDFVIGGARWSSPFIVRTDNLGNIKSSIWLKDSVNNQPIIITSSATINCVRETKRGTIICAMSVFQDQDCLCRTTHPPNTLKRYHCLIFRESGSQCKLLGHVAHRLCHSIFQSCRSGRISCG
jgi:hypothetical protein